METTKLSTTARLTYPAIFMAAVVPGKCQAPGKFGSKMVLEGSSKLQHIYRDCELILIMSDFFWPWEGVGVGVGVSVLSVLLFYS